MPPRERFRLNKAIFYVVSFLIFSLFSLTITTTTWANATTPTTIPFPFDCTNYPLPIAVPPHTLPLFVPTRSGDDDTEESQGYFQSPFQAAQNNQNNPTVFSPNSNPGSSPLQTLFTQSPSSYQQAHINSLYNQHTPAAISNANDDESNSTSNNKHKSNPPSPNNNIEPNSSPNTTPTYLNDPFLEQSSLPSSPPSLLSPFTTLQTSPLCTRSDSPYYVIGAVRTDCWKIADLVLTSAPIFQIIIRSKPIPCVNLPSDLLTNFVGYPPYSCYDRDGDVVASSIVATIQCPEAPPAPWDTFAEGTIAYHSPSITIGCGSYSNFVLPTSRCYHHQQRYYVDLAFSRDLAIIEQSGLYAYIKPTFFTDADPMVGWWRRVITVADITVPRKQEYKYKPPNSLVYLPLTTQTIPVGSSLQLNVWNSDINGNISVRYVDDSGYLYTDLDRFCSSRPIIGHATSFDFSDTINPPTGQQFLVLSNVVATAASYISVVEQAWENDFGKCVLIRSSYDFISYKPVQLDFVIHSNAPLSELPNDVDRYAQLNFPSTAQKISWVEVDTPTAISQFTPTPLNPSSPLQSYIYTFQVTDYVGNPVSPFIFPVDKIVMQGADDRCPLPVCIDNQCCGLSSCSFTLTETQTTSFPVDCIYTVHPSLVQVIGKWSQAVVIPTPQKVTFTTTPDLGHYLCTYATASGLILGPTECTYTALDALICNSSTGNSCGVVVERGCYEIGSNSILASDPHVCDYSRIDSSSLFHDNQIIPIEPSSCPDPITTEYDLECSIISTAMCTFQYGNDPSFVGECNQNTIGERYCNNPNSFCKISITDISCLDEDGLPYPDVSYCTQSSNNDINFFIHDQVYIPSTDCGAQATLVTCSSASSMIGLYSNSLYATTLSLADDTTMNCSEYPTARVLNLQSYHGASSSLSPINACNKRSFKLSLINPNDFATSPSVVFRLVPFDLFPTTNNCLELNEEDEFITSTTECYSTFPILDCSHSTQPCFESILKTPTSTSRIITMSAQVGRVSGTKWVFICFINGVPCDSTHGKAFTISPTTWATIAITGDGGIDPETAAGDIITNDKTTTQCTYAYDCVRPNRPWDISIKLYDAYSNHVLQPPLQNFRDSKIRLVINAKNSTSIYCPIGEKSKAQTDFDFRQTQTLFLTDLNCYWDLVTSTIRLHFTSKVGTPFVVTVPLLGGVRSNGSLIYVTENFVTRLTQVTPIKTILTNKSPPVGSFYDIVYGSCTKDPSSKPLTARVNTPLALLAFTYGALDLPFSPTNPAKHPSQFISVQLAYDDDVQVDRMDTEQEENQGDVLDDNNNPIPNNNDGLNGDLIYENGDIIYDYENDIIDDGWMSGNPLSTTAFTTTQVPKTCPLQRPIADVSTKTITITPSTSTTTSLRVNAIVTVRAAMRWKLNIILDGHVVFSQAFVSVADPVIAQISTPVQELTANQLSVDEENNVRYQLDYDYTFNTFDKYGNNIAQPLLSSTFVLTDVIENIGKTSQKSIFSTQSSLCPIPVCTDPTNCCELAPSNINVPDNLAYRCNGDANNDGFCDRNGCLLYPWWYDTCQQIKPMVCMVRFTQQYSSDGKLVTPTTCRYKIPYTISKGYQIAVGEVVSGSNIVKDDDQSIALLTNQSSTSSLDMDTTQTTSPSYTYLDLALTHKRPPVYKYRCAMTTLERMEQIVDQMDFFYTSCLPSNFLSSYCTSAQSTCYFVFIKRVCYEVNSDRYFDDLTMCEGTFADKTENHDTSALITPATVYPLEVQTCPSPYVSPTTTITTLTTTPRSISLPFDLQCGGIRSSIGLIDEAMDMGNEDLDDLAANDETTFPPPKTGLDLNNGEKYEK